MMAKLSFCSVCGCSPAPIRKRKHKRNRRSKKARAKDIAELTKALENIVANPCLTIGGGPPYCRCECHPENNVRVMAARTMFFDGDKELDY
jgi:hypothetical protein